MAENDLILAIIDFMARRRSGIRSANEIFQGVMDPSPQHPEKWRIMIEILEDMASRSLVTKSKHHMDGDRIEINYRLTWKGWRTSGREGKADEICG